MAGKRIARGIKIVLMVIIAVVVFGLVVEHLWNWLVPGIFGWKAISYVQALGLLVLSKLLFGGFHRHGPGGRGGWKRHMMERWEKMTPEERERFREGMRSRRWSCGPSWKQAVEPTAEARHAE